MPDWKRDTVFEPYLVPYGVDHSIDPWDVTVTGRRVGTA